MTTSAERLAAAVAAARRRPGPLRVDARRLGIDSLDGIEAAHDLRVLRLDHNAISDLTPVTALPHLTGLFVAHNAVADLSPLRRLYRLPALGLRGNWITDARPLRDATALTWLDLSDNRLGDGGFAERLPFLARLDLHGNALTAAPALHGTRLRAVDLSDNASPTSHPSRRSSGSSRSTCRRTH